MRDERYKTKQQLFKYEKRDNYLNTKKRKSTRINQGRTQRKVYTAHFPPFFIILLLHSTKSRSKLKPASNPFPNTRFIPHFFSVYKKRDSKLQIHQETFRPPLYPIPYSCPPYDGQHPSLTMSSRGPRLSQEHSDNHVNDALYRLTC